MLKSPPSNNSVSLLRVLVALFPCTVLLGGQPPLPALPLTTNTFKITLAWDESKETNYTVSGYSVYHGIASGNYTNSIDVGNVTQAVVHVPRGVTNYFAVTAYVAYTPSVLESDFSSEVYWPTNFLRRTNYITILLPYATAPTLNGPWITQHMQITLTNPTDTKFFKGLPLSITNEWR